MAETITRKEQRLEDTWNVAFMFANEADWEVELKSFREDLAGLSQYEGKLGSSAETLAEAFTLKLALERRLEHLFVYASMRADEDTSDAHFQDLDMRAMSAYNEYLDKVSYMEPEILSIGEEQVRGWIGENATLKSYERALELILREAPHTLSKEQEALLAQAGEVVQTASTAYNLLNNADMRFEPVEHKGETIHITNSTFVPLQMSEDRELREKVYNSFYRSYREHENTIASLFQSNLKASRFLSRARKFPSNRAMYLFNSNVPEELYDNLIETVHENLPAMHRYVSLRKQLLGVDELHFHDVYASLVKDYQAKYSFDEAKAMVLEAVKPLGEDYSKIVEGAFNDRWMDIYPNKGKRSGAYSSGSYDSLPYMLLNYTSELNDVFTLIHEMGHSVHSYLTHKHQPYVTGDYKIFVAEVASTCNEALLTHYLLQTTTDKEARKFILNHYMDSFKSTLYRQTMFAEFERIVHAKVEAGDSLTAPVLNDIYKKLNEEYFGPDMIVDDNIALEWARIPHFYRPFYVYQYATGFSAAIALSRRILEEGEPAVRDYLNFLSSGSAQDPIDTLRLAGVDMTQKEPVAAALEIFSSLIDEMEELVQAD